MVLTHQINPYNLNTHTTTMALHMMIALMASFVVSLARCHTRRWRRRCDYSKALSHDLFHSTRVACFSAVLLLCCRCNHNVVVYQRAGPHLTHSLKLKAKSPIRITRHEIHSWLNISIQWHYYIIEFYNQRNFAHDLQAKHRWLMGWLR